MADELSKQIKFEVLYDHYKDTFTHTKSYSNQRDRLFFLILVVVTLLLFQLIAPGESGVALSEFVTRQLKLDTAIDVSFISSLLWFSLLALVVRYFQRVITVERQYDYLHRLEAELSKQYGGEIFTREGISYLSSYKTFSNWAWRLYAVVFPVLLIVVTTIKIIGETRHQANFSMTLVFDVVAFLGIFVFTLLYVSSVHFQRAENTSED